MLDGNKTIEQLRERIAENPKDIVAHYNLATSLPPDQKEESLRLYKRALELDVKKEYGAVVHFNLGVITHLQKGNLDAAIGEFEEAAMDLPTMKANEELRRKHAARIHYNLGVIYFKRTQRLEHYGKEQEDMQKAVESFRETLKYNPNDLDAQQKLRNIENLITHGWFVTDDKGKIIKFFAGIDD